MRTLLAISLLFSALVGFSQSSDEELAAQFYNNGEFEKAADLYKKIHKDKPSSVYIYENYLNTLIALKENKDAESLVKKQIKRFPNSFNYSVDLGYIYTAFGEKDKAQDLFNDLVKENTRDRNKTFQLAQAFIKRRYLDWAIKTYELAIKHQDINLFWNNLINLYRATGDYKSMTDLGLNALEQNPNNLSTVLRHFSKELDEEDAATYIQERSLLYAQKNPDNQVFDELLMNIYIQRDRFRLAYRQAVAMDKRNNEEGRRLEDLARICISNKEYDVATQCYQYLIDKGPQSLFYIDGEVGLLNTLYLKSTEAYEADSLEIINLTNKYQDFMAKYSYRPTTVSSAKRLAELYLFYNNNPDRAIAVLERVLKVPQLHPNFAGETKLMLGDAYLIQGNIWDSKLLYGQVDKEFKEDPLGQEAKFRSARLSYFTGDFDWAKDQLEILKTATTQLISNNAIELALLIQDNTGLDSTEDAMKEYAQAEFLLYQNKTSECMDLLNLLPFKYPDHSLQDEIYFLKAQVMEKRGQFDKALSFYQRIYENFGSDILADNAIYHAAEIQLHIFKDKKLAKDLYEKLILDYNASLYVIEARKRYLELKESVNP